MLCKITEVSWKSRENKEKALTFSFLVWKARDVRKYTVKNCFVNINKRFVCSSLIFTCTSTADSRNFTIFYDQMNVIKIVDTIISLLLSLDALLKIHMLLNDNSFDEIRVDISNSYRRLQTILKTSLSINSTGASNIAITVFTCIIRAVESKTISCVQ